MKYDISIIIPTYNEAPRIEKTLSELNEFIEKNKLNVEVIVADAQSPDGTANIVKKYERKFDSLKILDAGPKPAGKFIKGLQVKEAMLVAKGKYVLFMDADLATPLNYIKDVVEQLDGGKEVSICVRDLNSSHKGIRKMVSSVGNGLVQMLLLPGIKDTQCGFKAFTNKSSKEIFALQTIKSWGFDMEILAIARKRGYSIGLIDVPDWKDVEEGSKISGSSPIKASLQTLADLFRIRWRLLRGYYNTKT